MSHEKMNAKFTTLAALGFMTAAEEKCNAHGVFTATCYEGEVGSRILWQDTYKNVVTTLGKNFILDNALAGSAYTAALYLGVISSVSYASIPVAADTAASHATWTEAGATNAPAYSGNRKTAAWAAAASGSKALTAPLSFTFTSSGTIKGSFLSSTATVDSTSGTLLSAGLFTGGDQPVVSGNTVTVTYSMGL